jgi:hypothetical protein
MQLFLVDPIEFRINIVEQRGGKFLLSEYNATIDIVQKLIILL